jgi:hypothetical protein
MGSEHVTYEIQFDWADGPVLQDLFVSWDVSRRETFEIQLGQFKVPSGRQRLTSSGALQFVDRSIVADEFTEGQDIGLQVVGLVADQRMEYRVGVFNGAGQNTLSGRQGAQYNGRLMFQPFGPLDYSEGDLEFARGPLLAVAASLDMDDGRQRVGTERPGRTTIGADAAFRYRGLSLVGELFLRSGSREIGRTPRQVGFLVQGGYFVVPSRLEIAGRLATCDPAAPAPGDQEREVGLAAGYFLNGHNLKVQSDVRRLEDHRQKRADHELRVQLQIVF